MGGAGAEARWGGLRKQGQSEMFGWARGCRWRLASGFAGSVPEFVRTHVQGTRRERQLTVSGTVG